MRTRGRTAIKGASLRGRNYAKRNIQKGSFSSRKATSVDDYEDLKKIHDSITEDSTNKQKDTAAKQVSDEVYNLKIAIGDLETLRTDLFDTADWAEEFSKMPVLAENNYYRSTTKVLVNVANGIDSLEKDLNSAFTDLGNRMTALQELQKYLQRI